MNVREGKIPTGKGMFIYVLSSSWPGSMASLADFLKENNYSWVAPKMQDGRLPFQPTEMDEFVQEINRVGIDLVGWGYVYGETNLWRRTNNWCNKEADITIQMIQKYKPIAWMVDAEKEHKNNSYAADSAKKYMDLIRAEMAFTNDAIPDIPILFSSYKFPDSHNIPGTQYTFPFAEFLARSDAIAPQVYWWRKNYQEASVEELQISMKQYDQYISSLPYVPAGTFRNDSGTWWAIPEQLELFNEACLQNERILGCNYWDLKFSQQRSELADVVNGFIWEADEPEPPIPPIGECDCVEMLRYLGEIKKETEEINAICKDLETNLASHHTDVMEALEGGTPEPPPEPPSDDTKFVTVDRDGKQVYLFFEHSYNAQGKPIFQIYPSDNSDVKDRIAIPSMGQVEVWRGSKTTGNGGAVGWKCVDNRGAIDADGKEVQLYVMEKFIV